MVIWNHFSIKEKWFQKTICCDAVKVFARWRLRWWRKAVMLREKHVQLSFLNLHCSCSAKNGLWAVSHRGREFSVIIPDFTFQQCEIWKKHRKFQRCTKEICACSSEPVSAAVRGCSIYANIIHIQCIKTRHFWWLLAMRICDIRKRKCEYSRIWTLCVTDWFSCWMFGVCEQASAFVSKPPHVEICHD